MSAIKERFLGGLLHLAIEQGKSDKWVLAQYMAKFGEWPQYHEGKWGVDWRAVGPVEPTKALREFCRKRAIAYAKKLEAERKAKRKPRASRNGYGKLEPYQYAHLRAIKKELA